MAQKVKVVSATYKRDVNTKNGVMYSYDIKVENDVQTYQYLAKTNPQTKFVVGAEMEVEITQNGNYYNIKPAQQGGGFGGGANSGSRLELDKKIAALNNAVALAVAGKVELANLKATYDKFLNEYL